MKNKLLRTSLIVALLGSSEVVLAATATTNIPVTTTVTQVCSISTTTALAFAGYNPIVANAVAALNASGQISVACSKGSSGLTIGLDSGRHVAGTQRQMAGTTVTNLLQYNIYQPPNNTPNTACTFPGTTAWTNLGAGMLTLTNAPAKTARLYSVCGTIPGGQDVAADAYSDIVIATINF